MENLMDLVPGLDFRREMEAHPELKEFIHEACNQYTMEFRDVLLADPHKPKLDVNYDNFVVLTGIPIISYGKDGWQDKVKKLRSRLASILNKHGIDFSEDQALHDITIPDADDGSRTESLAFLNMGNEKRAAKALQVLDKYQMSEKFVFSAIPFSKFNDTVKIPPHFTPPSVMSVGELGSWLAEHKDQMFMHHFGSSLNLSWFHPEDERKILEPVLGPSTDAPTTQNRERIQGGNLHQFSPLGTYLGSRQDKHTIVLNGGHLFDSVRGFSHFNVDAFQISPNEKQILTVSNNQNEAIFWDVETGEELRKFETAKFISAFKWSNDTRYLARATLSKAQEKFIEQKVAAAQETGFPASFKLVEALPTQLSIYSAETLDMLVNPENQKKSSIKLPHNVHDFQFSRGPRSELLYYISRDIQQEKKSISMSGLGGPKLNENHHPKTIHVLNVVNRQMLLEKTILGAKVSEIHWHPCLDILAIVKHRHLEKPKEARAPPPQRGGPKKMPQPEKVQNSIEIYKFKKDSTEAVTMEMAEMINGFAWHPTLPYFAYLRKQEPQPASQHTYACAAKVVAYYQKPKGFAFERFEETAHHQDSYSHIFWAPNQLALVAANAKSMQTASMGKMGFYLLDEKRQISHIKTQEHEGATVMTWDPSGRYFASCLMKDEKKATADEASFRIFNMSGELIFLKRLPSLAQFQWRPRPKKVLSSEEQGTLEKKMPETTKRLQQTYKLQKEERIESRKASREAKEKEFMKYLEGRREEHRAQKKQREKLLGREEEKLEIVLEEFELEENILSEEFVGVERP